MKLGIQVVSIIPSVGIFKFLCGARFGISGIRRLLGIPSRPILFTAIKPMGLSASNLAGLASQFADGGIDIIKDDHGLSNQPFSPFQERVKRCTAAVQESNIKTGRKSIYVPNITAPIDCIFERANFAKGCGVGGLMISPGLVGLDVMRSLVAEIGLPIIAHPAFIGGMAMPRQGLTCGVLYGTLMRLAGADATIFPNCGGRFPLTLEDCKDIVLKCRETLGNIPPIFPSPAGGMELKNIKSMLQNYGKDMLLLIGSGLFAQGNNLIDNCKIFLKEAESA
jgi:ribulose-bisphosphate carboxylase large chain